MKTHFKLLSAIALLSGACSTGSMVSSRGHADDVYFTPGDNPPPVVVHSSPSRTQQVQEPVRGMATKQDKASKIVDDYFNKNQDNDKNKSTYRLNNQNADADTLAESDDDDLKSTIGDYDDEDDVNYSTRIRTFYDPYCYDPFWDSYGYGGLSMNMGWGLGFGGMYGGWYDPWYSYGWGGYPYYGGYYGGFYGLGFYGGGYYGGGYYGGGYYGGGHWGGSHGSGRDRYYGRQNFAGRVAGTPNSMAIGGLRNGTLGSSAIRSGSINRTSPGVGTSSISTRQAGTRYAIDPNVTKNARINPSGQQGSTTTRSNGTLMNLRRSQPTNYVRQGTGASVQSNGQGATRSASTTNNSQRYIPTYSRPRTNTQATYNSGTTRQYIRPQSSASSGSSGSTGYSRYSKPQSSYSGASTGSSVGSSNSYQRRSDVISAPSSSPSRVGGSYGSSSGTYSAPSRSSSGGSSSGSYSAPSNSGGGGGGGGGSFSGGGGSSSGGGGGGRRR